MNCQCSLLSEVQVYLQFVSQVKDEDKQLYCRSISILHFPAILRLNVKNNVVCELAEA